MHVGYDVPNALNTAAYDRALLGLTLVRFQLLDVLNFIFYCFQEPLKEQQTNKTGDLWPWISVWECSLSLASTLRPTWLHCESNLWKVVGHRAGFSLHGDKDVKRALSDLHCFLIHTTQTTRSNISFPAAGSSRSWIWPCLFGSWSLKVVWLRLRSYSFRCIFENWQK